MRYVVLVAEQGRTERGPIREQQAGQGRQADRTGRDE